MIWFIQSLSVDNDWPVSAEDGDRTPRFHHSGTGEKIQIHVVKLSKKTRRGVFIGQMGDREEAKYSQRRGAYCDMSGSVTAWGLGRYRKGRCTLSCGFLTHRGFLESSCLIALS